MSNAIVFGRGWLILLIAVSLAACGSSDENSSQTSLSVHADSADLKLHTYDMGERDALRVRKDVLRNRLWVLTLDDVRVYDLAKERLIR